MLQVGGQTYIWPTNHVPATAKSLIFLCINCGDVYAKFQTYVGTKLQPFSGVHGCCPTCPSDRYYVAGSLECLTFLGWRDFPIEVLRLQLEAELDFLSHPNHPHNSLESLFND